MDSGNSGSLQSSSGGDEEYDSRAADSIFMSTRPAPHVGPISNPPPPLFDPLSNYMQLHQSPNISLLNPNMSWPRTMSLRSDPNSTSHDIINPMLSRASRRAPTTVLTTDTTNFRAMVQEFTGIPAPPFNSSSFPRSRLDLFGTRSAALDAVQPLPPYLRRPFAQKIPSNHIKIAGLDEFGLGHGNHVTATPSGLPNLISSDQIAAQNDRNDNTDSNNAASWRNNGVSRDEGDDYQAQMKPVNGAYNFPRNTTNGKMNYAASSSNFHGEKGPENIATRGEGMVESWICSSE
ncbi:hypothetical protein Pfo_018722 [Paulownia fortunei]|nr:hypothetical protein Pfo_018722 [Paulownia fortunei]